MDTKPSAMYSMLETQIAIEKYISQIDHYPATHGNDRSS